MNKRLLRYLGLQVTSIRSELHSQRDIYEVSGSAEKPVLDLASDIVSDLILMERRLDLLARKFRDVDYSGTGSCGTLKVPYREGT